MNTLNATPGRRFGFAALLVLAQYCSAGAVPIDPATARLMPQSPAQADPKTALAAQAIVSARAALARRDFAAAYAGFQKAASLVPNAPGPFLGMAEVAHQQNDRAMEDKYLAQAEHIAPKVAIVLVARARYYVATTQYAAALANLDQAAKAEPASAQIQNERGDIYLSGLHNPLLAIGAYKAALALDKNDIAAQYALGSALNAVGHSKEAKEQLLAVTKNSPGNPEAWSALGGALLNLGEDGRAQGAFEKAIALAPSLWGARIGLGDALTAQHKYADAISAYQAAKKLEPKSVLPDVRAGNVYQLMGKADLAEAAYRRAMTGDPADLSAKNNLAFILADGGQKLDEALRLSLLCVAAAPKDPGYQDTLAWVYRARKDDARAAAILTKISSANPNPDFFYHLGIVEQDMGHRDQAVSALQAALKIAPGYQPAAEEMRRLSKP